MRPRLWSPPIELTEAEQKIVSRIKRAKLFIFLRQVRHEIFDEVFQAELGAIYKGQSKRTPAGCPGSDVLDADFTGLHRSIR